MLVCCFRANKTCEKFDSIKTLSCEIIFEYRGHRIKRNNLFVTRVNYCIKLYVEKCKKVTDPMIMHGWIFFSSVCYLLMFVVIVFFCHCKIGRCVRKTTGPTI